MIDFIISPNDVVNISGIFGVFISRAYKFARNHLDAHVLVNVCSSLKSRPIVYCGVNDLRRLV